MTTGPLSLPTVLQRYKYYTDNNRTIRRQCYMTNSTSKTSIQHRHMIHAAIGLTGRSLNLNRPCLERDIVPTLCRKPWLGPIHTGSTHATSISARIRAGNREGRRGLREDSSARLRSRQKFRRVVGRRHAQELYLLGHHFSRYNEAINLFRW